MKEENLTQEQQYLRYGCMPRCIEELAARMNVSLDETEFTKLVKAASSMKLNQYGCIRLSDVIDLGRYFSLFSNADSLRDFKKMKELFGQGVRKALLLTERSRNQEGELHHLYHCSLVTDFPKSGGVEIWSPLQNGDSVEIVMHEEEYENRLGHFVVLT